MTTFITLLRSPVGPFLVLIVGAVALAIFGRWLRRPLILTGLALLFVGFAGILWLDLRFQPIVPTYGRAWQPLFQSGANLYWLGDGWNWYIAGLMLLVGGLVILLDMDEHQRTASQHGASLAVNLAITGAGTLFVSSGNLLTAVFTWVLLDVMILVRGVLRPTLADSSEGEQPVRWYSHTRGLSLLGAILLLVSLLPAGPQGPGQSLQGGTLPYETLLLMLGAALLRTGVYPLHFWLLPDKGDVTDIAERLLDHVAPVLSGMWLVGWTISLGGQPILQSTEVLTFLVLSMLLAAFAAFTTRDAATHATFVLIAAAGQCLIAGALFYSGRNPAAMIWPATTFTLGGALWLVGGRIWQVWRWQLPVSVGALALAGAPFTPGFLMQPSFASLMVGDTQPLIYFIIYVIAQGLLIAALLRTWSPTEAPALDLPPPVVLRLLIAAIAIALPLALAGFLPQVVSAMANIPGAIPPVMGTPPSVVAPLPVWIPLIVSLALGITIILVSPRFSPKTNENLGRVGSLLRLDWLFQSTGWSFAQFSARWGSGFGVIEGAGYMGWMLVFFLLAYLLVA